MAYEICINANSNLSVDEVYDVLSKDVEIQVDEDNPDTLLGDGFYCYVSRIEAEAECSDYFEKPVTLDIRFRYHPAANGNVDFLTFVLNWLRYTDADTVLEHNSEFITLLRVDGKLIKNINPQVVKYSGNLELGDIPYEEANLGLYLPYDHIYVDSVHEVPQIIASYCRHLFDDHETKIDEGLTAVAPREIRATVERDAFEIRAVRRDPFKWSLKWKKGEDRYPFVPNCHVDLHYRKGRGIQQPKNAAYIVPARDDMLKGVAGLIKTTDYSLVVEFSDPKRDVLMYHAGELTLFEDSCWTEERLDLFDGIPYKFSTPIP